MAADGLKPAEVESDSTPKPEVVNDQAARWDAMTAADRLPVLKRAGWTEGSKSTQAMQAKAWEKLSETQRKKVADAMGEPAQDQGAAVAPAGPVTERAMPAPVATHTEPGAAPEPATAVVVADKATEATDEAKAEQPAPDTRDNINATTDRERALRDKAHDTEKAGDVMLGNGRFVSFDDAVTAARKAVADGALDPTKPFQFNRVLDIAPASWDRMVQALAESETSPTPQGERNGDEAKAQAQEVLKKEAPADVTTVGATAQAAIDAWNMDDHERAMAVVSKIRTKDELRKVGDSVGFSMHYGEGADAYRKRLAEVAPRLNKTEREKATRQRALFDKLMGRAMDYDRAADHAERANSNGVADDSTAYDAFYKPMDGGETTMVRIPELLNRLAADVGSLRSDPDYAEVAPMVQSKRPRVFEHEVTTPEMATHADPGEAAEPATPAVVAESITKAAKREDRKPSEMKADLLRQIDAKLADAQDEYLPTWKAPTKDQIRKAMVGTGTTNKSRIVQMLEGQHQNRVAEAADRIGYVMFDVPGDGKFKVLNTKSKLTDFRRQVESSPGFKNTSSAPKPEGSSGGEKGYGGAKAAIEGMIDEGDAQAAVDYAAMKGLDLAEVLKGQPERLKKVQGLTPTGEAEEAPAPAAEPAPKRTGQYEASEVFAIYRAAESAARGLWSSSGAGKHNTKLRKGLRELGLKQTQVDNVMAEAATVHAQRTRGSTTMTYLSGQDFMAGARRAGVVPEQATAAPAPAAEPTPAAPKQEAAAEQPAPQPEKQEATPALVNGAIDAFVKTLKTREDDAGNVAMFSRATTTGPRVNLESARQLADQLASTGLLRLNVVQSTTDMPMRLQRQLSKSAPDGRVRGAYFRGTDEVWMVADHIRGANEFVEVALHEAFHRGLGKLIPEAQPLLREIWRTNQNVRKVTADQMRQHGIGRDEAIEEALAKMAEAGEVRDLKGWPKLLEAIRTWLGKMARAVGIEMVWTDDMVADLVAASTREGLKAGVHADPATDAAAAKRAPAVTVETDEATGAPVYATDDISIGFPQETERFEYVLQDGEKIVNYSIGPADGFDSYGFVELVIGADGIPKALADIEVKPELRGQAIGEKVMAAILGAHPDADIEISNIVEGARGFWAKMGVPEQNRAAGEAYDGTLNYQTFQEAQDERAANRAAAGRGAAGEGRNASAEGRAQGADGQAQGLMLSRAEPADATDMRATPRKVSAQDLVNSAGGVFDFNRLGETKQDRIRSVVDGSRPFWMGALTRDQLADVYGAEIPQVREYDQITRIMENERSKRAQDADTIYQEWSKLRPAVNLSVSRIMADATLYSVDPDGEFKPQTGNVAGDEEDRQRVHERISKEFAALPPDAKAIYEKVKAFHLQTLTDLQKALTDRIERQVAAGSARQAALTDIRKQFDKYLQNGPYFPLSRFGDYLVVANRESDGERVVASYETAGEQQAAARKLQADGFSVKLKTAKTYSRADDGAAGKFIGDVLSKINDLDIEGASLGGSMVDLKSTLLDDVNQLFIRALPDLSYRKHFAHRKGTPGFSSDMMRGFASSAFHSASHIARLNHADKMTFVLRDAYAAIENIGEGDFNKHSQVLNELTKRHDAALNPNTHPIASFLNSLGFTMYLGLSPAAGLVNLLQVPMVAMPYFGARYGFRTASVAFGKAYKDIMSAPMNRTNGFNAAESLQLTPAERAAIKTLQDEGVIDLTQAHDLASATGLDTGNVARSKASFAMARAMKIVGWTFHVPEVMNRQVTALMAYRLEMKASGNADAAVEAARTAIKRTQFDYSASNRARYMQGNLARVVTQFKQYSQNMTYLLARSMHQALRGETPEVRSIARRQLIATLGVTFAMAGSLGLPGIGMLGGLLGIAAGAVGDDDDPWDWKVEFRNLMADTFGKEIGEVVSHGVPRALMPWDLSNRVGLGDMWFRDGSRAGDNPREAFAAHMANVLGPTAGTILGWYTAADHMARGNYAKAAESITPKFIRDSIKGVREGTEGVTSYSGEPLMDVTAPEAIGRVLGFAPSRASEMYEARGAVMNAKTTIDEKRTALLGKLAKARMDGDAEKAADLQQEAIAWNRRNPEARITPQHIRQSIMARRRQRQNTEDGITLPKNRENLRELGRFANMT